MARVFVDSGAWIALINEKENRYARARAYLESSVQRRAQFLTTNYVVQEAATRLRYDAGPAAAKIFGFDADFRALGFDVQPAS